MIHIHAKFAPLDSGFLPKPNIPFYRHRAIRLSQPVSFATLLQLQNKIYWSPGLIKKLRQVKVIRGLTEKKGNFHDLTYFPTRMGVGVIFWMLDAIIN